MEPLEDDPNNPARGWLSSYQREVALARKADPKPRSRGAFGGRVHFAVCGIGANESGDRERLRR